MSRDEQRLVSPRPSDDELGRQALRLSCNIGPDDNAFLSDYSRRKGVTRKEEVERAVRIMILIERASRIQVREPDGYTRDVVFPFL